MNLIEFNNFFNNYLFNYIIKKIKKKLHSQDYPAKPMPWLNQVFLIFYLITWQEMKRKLHCKLIFKNPKPFNLFYNN